MVLHEDSNRATIAGAGKPGDAAFGSAADPAARADRRGWHSRGYLPHFDDPGLVQMVTYRLIDSLPRDVLRSTPDLAGKSHRRESVEDLLDDGLGKCFLTDQRVAGMVEQEWLHFDRERYCLLAWVVMPNHVHVVFETGQGYSLSSILHSWKSYTAKVANELLGRSGAFWQPDYFDRAIRDDRHLTAVVEYIHNNPVKAGLTERAEDWPFSSAAWSRPKLSGGRVARAPKQEQLCYSKCIATLRGGAPWLGSACARSNARA